LKEYKMEKSDVLYLKAIGCFILYLLFEHEQNTICAVIWGISALSWFVAAIADIWKEVKGIINGVTDVHTDNCNNCPARNNTPES